MFVLVTFYAEQSCHRNNNYGDNEQDITQVAYNNPSGINNRHKLVGVRMDVQQNYNCRHDYIHKQLVNQPLNGTKNKSHNFVEEVKQRTLGAGSIQGSGLGSDTWYVRRSGGRSRS